MRKVIYAFSVSLDGFIEDRGGTLDWVLIDDELHRHFNELERGIALAFYGRRLYELMAAAWPTADQNPDAQPAEIEYAPIWRALPKVVFSDTLEEVGWNARLLPRDAVAGEVARLKAEAGGDMSVGGAELAGEFMRLGLIDEYRVYVHPVILGGGKAMFAELPDAVQLELVETQVFGSGVVMLRYRKGRR